MKCSFVILMSFALFMSSCAVNRHLNFSGKAAGPGYLTGKPAWIAVQDKRTAVLNGKEKTSWCGHNYSMAQISYNIQTNNGRALADEFAELIARSYSMQGASAHVLYVYPEQSTDSLLHAYQAAGNGLLLLLEIREWESKATPGFSTIRYEQLYDLKLTALDENGQSLASGEVHGTYSEKEGAITNMAHLQEIADHVLRSQVEALFNEASIRTLIARQ